jgi:hypothetical protein
LTSNYASTMTVSVLAGSLALTGNTLFVTVYGQGEGTTYGGYARCSVPASLPRATVAGRAPAAASIPTGTYGACTTDYGYGYPGWDEGGGESSRVLAESQGTLTVTQAADAGYPVVCPSLAFDGVAGSTATLSSGETCTVQAPCGPPPSLGPSSAPGTAVLTNMTGAIQRTGGVLFVNVVGEAPSDACGSHIVSLICPEGP